MKLNSHTIITGKTNSGKTTLALKFFEEDKRLSIFINTQLQYIKGVKEIDLKDLDIRKLAENKKLSVIPTEDNNLNNQLLLKFTKEIFSLGLYKFPKYRPDNPIISIYVDEAHEFSLKNTIRKEDYINSLERIAKRGLRFGVRQILITQQPSDLNLTLLRQAENHFIFSINKYELEYYKNKGLNLIDDYEYIQQPYYFIMFDGITFKRFKPIKL